MEDVNGMQLDDAMSSKRKKSTYDTLENPVITNDFLSIRSKWRQANSTKMKGNTISVGPGKDHHERVKPS